MDPSVLVAPQWDNSDENINNNCGSEGKEDADGGTEDDEYLDSMSRNQNSMLDSMFMAAQKMNQMNVGQNFFYCEHCPKYFVDEDHLQLHIKRTHGLNKMNQCNICGKAYAWKSGLYKHKRHVHNIGGTGTKITPNGGNGDSDSPVDSQPPTPTDVQQIQSSSTLEVITKINNNNNNNNNDNGRIYNHSLTSLFNNGRLKMSDNLDQQNNGRQHIPYKNLKKTQSNQHLLHGQSLPASSGFDSLSSSSSSSSLSIIIELYIGCHLIMIILLSLWQ